MYKTTTIGSSYFDFLGEKYCYDVEAQKRRQEMTTRDWAIEQILILAEDGITYNDLKEALKHGIETLYDELGQLSEPKSKTKEIFQTGLDDLDNILRNLTNIDLISN